MEKTEMGMDQELTLDGNAAAGILQEIFAAEITVAPAECSNCGNVSAVGGLTAFTQAPGIVLRCPACGEVMLRVMRTPHGIIFEARGTARIVLSG